MSLQTLNDILFAVCSNRRDQKRLNRRPCAAGIRADRRRKTDMELGTLRGLPGRHKARRKEQMQKQIRAMTEAPLAFAVNSKQPDSTFLLRRGDVEKPREEVTAGALSVVRALPADFGMPNDSPEGRRRARPGDFAPIGVCQGSAGRGARP